MSAADLLIEIGTEELPPTALAGLMTAFAEGLSAALDEADLKHGQIRPYASPRRLAVIVEDLEHQQADRAVTRRGPPVTVAFDQDGKPLPAATAFAKMCGVEVDALGREHTAKGEWLCFETVDRGQPAAALIPDFVERALAGLPIPKPMRWGAGEVEFVRPVHWVVLLHGERVVDATVLGVAAGNLTRGHRFLGRNRIEIGHPGEYLDKLETEGRVIADPVRRHRMIREGVEAIAAETRGVVAGSESLYDEVAALVEWPVPMLGSFDAQYLELPREAVISTLTGHQRYFPIADADGTLKPLFVTVANIESRDPDVVRDGNERVIRPRLADAAFFWDTDRKRSLASRLDQLKDVVYQRGLGSLRDKSARTANLAAAISATLGLGQDAERAAMLSKCDLLTGMVGEFPELQGTMGGYYARADGELETVAAAIGEHYRPRFAGDTLPATNDGRVLALADRLDTLAGAFVLGKKPSGNRDPFGLRRAALGVVRILVECGLDLDIKQALAAAVAEQPTDGAKGMVESVADELYDYVTDRLRHYFLERDPDLDTETFDAVIARAPVSLVDFEQRLKAVQAFIDLDEAQSLATANKRIANILRQAGGELTAVQTKRFEDEAERALYEALATATDTVGPLLAERRYTDALCALAALREPVDRFFDDVMVMVDDAELRANRLALLAGLRALFLDVADVSRLSIA